MLSQPPESWIWPFNLVVRQKQIKILQIQDNGGGRGYRMCTHELLDILDPVCSQRVIAVQAGNS
jgi:hypothetical protein